MRERDHCPGVLWTKVQKTTDTDAIAVQLPEGARCPLGQLLIGDVSVLFDRICRENGIEHLLTAPR